MAYLGTQLRTPLETTRTSQHYCIEGYMGCPKTCLMMPRDVSLSTSKYKGVYLIYTYQAQANISTHNILTYSNLIFQFRPSSTSNLNNSIGIISKLRAKIYSKYKGEYLIYIVILSQANINI